MVESDGPQNQSPNLPSNGAKDSIGKSCKGCLYYSSLQKSKSKSPTCVGLSKTLEQVPNYIVGETEQEASKEGRSLTDFKYACVGYSVYLEKKGSSNDDQNKQAELPFCVGLEVLLDKRPAEQSQAHIHNKTEVSLGDPTSVGEENETFFIRAWKPLPNGCILKTLRESPKRTISASDSPAFPQPRSYKPSYPAGDEYLNRFKRNAALVASGVARNVNRVCNYIKESFDDIIYPYRRRPK